MNQLELPGKLRPIFENESNVVFAYMFGSIPKGNARFGSDLDIAIYFKTEPNLNEIGRLTLQLENASNYKIDIIQLNNLDNLNPVLAYSIISEGNIFINKKPDLLIEFKKFVLLKYLDFKPTNDLINKSFSYRLSNNTFAVFEK